MFDISGCKKDYALYKISLIPEINDNKLNVYF